MISNLVLLALPLVATYLVATIWHRRFKQFAHFPQFRTSFVWGHLRTVHEWSMKAAEHAPDPHHDIAFVDMAKALGNPPLIFLDLRPVSYPMALITSHEIAEQISRSTKERPWSAPKSPTMKSLVSLTGPESILFKDGDHWKQLRKRFNPGFAPHHLMTLLPCILDKTDIFLRQLDRYADAGSEFPLLTLTINLTFDIIGAITMNVDFDAQSDSSGQGKFIRLYEQLLQEYGVTDSQFPWWFYPRREWRRYVLSKQIDNHLDAAIRTKHREQQQQQQQQQQHDKARARDILSLSLQGSSVLSKELLNETRDQIKTFLFAGHDTTGILLAWLFYELSRSPHALKAVRDELDHLLGPDTDPAAVRARLLAPGGEELIHKMTYTTAVIKEVLRLHPPAGSARMTPPGTGFTVTTPDGQSFCLDGMILYLCATIVQRDRRVYGDTADDFMPERWLGDKAGVASAGADADAEQHGEDARKHPPGAWRPFERGPRNCIGQDLATIEARVIVAAVARRYDFSKVGLGELDLDEKGQPELNDKGQYKVKSEMYNTKQVTAKPVDGMRMKVRRRA